MKNLSLKIKIQSLTALFTIIFFSVFSMYLYKTQKEKITKLQNLQMSNQVKELNNFIDIQLEGNQKEVNSAMKLAHHIFYSEGKLIENTEKKIEMPATNQITKNTHTELLNTWTLKGKPIHNNFELVDKIKKLSVETVTIFQKINDGYLRISTNVMKLDGNRAVGTFIPSRLKASKTVSS